MNQERKRVKTEPRHGGAKESAEEIAEEKAVEKPAKKKSKFTTEDNDK